MSWYPKSERPCTDCGKPFIGGPPAKYCPGCRWKHRGRRPKKYVWTPELDAWLRANYDGRVRRRADELGRQRGWPGWVIKRRAQTLGLSYAINRKDWTPEEELFLWDHAGSRLMHWIAKKLRRSETSVVMKLKHMQISRRFKEGYTMRELELCFGTDHHVIERWAPEGKLQIQKRGTDRPRDAWMVTDEQILAFVRDHPMAFRLDKVDQYWFLDLITSGGLIRKALQDERVLTKGESR